MKISLHELGLISALDRRFALRMAGLAGVDSVPVQLGIALTSRAPAVGDVGVDLATIGAALQDLTEVCLPPLPDASTWASLLRETPALVRLPHEARAAPLVLDGTDLYLERYWTYQQQLGANLRKRLAQPDRPVDSGHLDQLVAQLKFEDPRAALQLQAVRTAARRGFSVLAGGPGTGKTAVVVKLLAALQPLETARTGRPLRIKLAAPTGKAAARMSEAIRQQAGEWVPENLRDAVVSIEASTIHRLLGSTMGRGFRHHAENPLAVDLLIIDEASMVDLPLMCKLLDAVPTEARVLLLGDPDQLASVELGRVFADICASAGNALTTLTHVWRYQAGSGIEALAKAVNAGDAAASLRVLNDPGFPDVTLRSVSSGDLLQAIDRRALRHFLHTARAESVDDALQGLRGLRVLGAHRHGYQGVNELNAHLDARVRGALGVPVGQDWYQGRPVMITRNDHDLQLYNGDVGIVRGDPLRVWFETPTGVRDIGAALLPEHDTVFATTVHKSQGSEYEHVVLVLPARVSAVVTRELLYTAVTRATKRVTVLGAGEVWGAGVARKVQRMSRLGREIRSGRA